MSELLLQGLYPGTEQTDNFRMLQQVSHIFVFNAFLLRIVLDKPVHRHNQGRNELALICDNSDLIDIAVNNQFGFQRLRGNILSVRCLEQVLDTFCKEKLSVLEITGISRMEPAVSINSGSRSFRFLIISFGDAFSTKQNFISKIMQI